MLRITMLKLKRAWSLALTLRNRGDTRIPEKIHRLMTVRTAQKSTNSDKDSQWKRKQIIDYLFSPLRTHDEIRRIQSIIISDIRRLQKAINKQKEEQNPQTPICRISPNAQIEKCNKLITAIFGEERTLDSGKASDAIAPERQVETVLSTTAKQPKEKLLQKVEVIEETPLVEAEKPKIEGFNTPPRVLGFDLQHSPNIDVDGETADTRGNERDKIKSMIRRLEDSEILSKVTPITYGVANFSGDSSNQGGKSGDTSGRDKKDTYDSIAKRLLNTPNNELDKRLIKEMKKLGVPQGLGNSSMKIRRDANKKPRKPSAKTEIELEARKYKNDPLTASGEEKKALLAKNVHIRSLQVTSKPTFVSRLHEEGIRYTEQITPTLDDKGEKRYKHLERRPLYDPHKPILQSQNKETGADNFNDKQKAAYLNMVKSKEQPSELASQVLKLPQQQTPWTTKHPYFQDLSVGKNLNYACAQMKERRPPFDPYKAIIDPHDKKNIASDTENYGYEPLSYHTANTITENKSVKKSHIAESENTIVQPLKAKTPESFPEVTSQCPELSSPEPEKIVVQPLEANTPESFPDITSQNLEVKTLEPVKTEVKPLIAETPESFSKVTPQLPELKASEPEKTVVQLLEAKTLESFPEVTSLHLEVKRPEPVKIVGQLLPDKNPVSFSEGISQHLEVKTPEPVKIVGQPLIAKQIGSFPDVAPQHSKVTTQKPDVSVGRTLKTKSPGSYPEVTSQGKEFNSKLPFYNNEHQNHTYFGQLPYQQNVWSSSQSYESLKNQTANVLEQDKNDEKSHTAATEKSPDQSSTANQTPGSYSEVTYQGMYLNRNMPYNYNQIFTNSGPCTNQQHIWSNPKGYDPSRYQIANATEQSENDKKSDTEESETLADSSSTPIQTSELNPNATYQGMYTNKYMTFYNNQNYPNSGHLTGQQNFWLAPKETPQQESSHTNENTPARASPYLDPNQTFADKYSDVEAKDIKSEIATLNPAYEFPNENANVNPVEKSAEYPYFEKQQSQESNENVPADENPDNIMLDQHTGDPSYDQTQQLNPWMNPYQNYQENQASKENMPGGTNPDNIVIDQHTSDPSYKQISQEQDSANFTPQMKPWINPYQFSQQQGHATDEHLPADANPDNMFLDQHTEDPSYEEVSSHPWINQQRPYVPAVAKAGKVEQLHAALYTADPSKGKQGNFPEYSNFPHQFNPWNQYPHSQDQSMSNPASEDQQESQDMNQPEPMNTLGNTNRRPPYDAHRPISGHKSYYQRTTDQEIEATENAVPPFTNETPESQSRVKPQATFYPHFQQFQQPASFVAQNPYFYHQNFTHFGNSPHQHDFWQNQHSPEGQMSQFYQQQFYFTKQEAPEAAGQASIHPDQKTPVQATEMRPVLSYTRDPKFRPPAGPSAAFISLPVAKWKAGTSLRPSPQEEPLPDEKVQVDCPETISPLPEVDIPSPKDEDVPLSELLRRVRQRSRQEYIARWTKVDPFEGKCGRKRPPCPPPQPICPTPPPAPSPPCPPPPPACPRPCKPNCPSPCTPPTPGCPPPTPPCPTPRCPCCKFVAISLGDTLYNIFTLIWDFGSSILIKKRSLTDCCSAQSAGCATRAIITEDVVTQLQILGNNLLTTYGSDLGRYCWKLETLALARGFEPWVPVPSWPLPIKKKKKPFVCPKEGCKERPPPRYGDPCERPCYPGSPCLGFPNKYRKH